MEISGNLLRKLEPISAAHSSDFRIGKAGFDEF
jgi:hypothetical protein